MNIPRKIFNLVFLLPALFSVSCTTKSGDLFFGALGLGKDRIYLSGTYLTATNYVVTSYDSDGKFLGILSDLGEDTEYPRAIAFLDPYHLVIAVEGVDRLDKVSIFGERTTFAVDAGLTGTIFDIERDSAANFYVVETSTIEKFDNTGTRYNSAGNPYIPGTVGACTLNVPHGLAINSNGELVVVSSGNDTINIYDLSVSPAGCVSSTAVGAIDPWDVASGPDGNLYFVTQTNDSIYKAAADGSGATIIYSYGVATANPSAIAVLPNGNLLVANNLTDAIDLFSSDGTLIKSMFIKNSFTVDVGDIEVVRGQ